MNHEDMELKIKQKNQLVTINIHNRRGLIISSLLISVSLIICWMFWIDLYRSDVNEIINVINIEVNFKFEFQQLTIVILVFATINLFFITLPFLFLKSKDLKTIIIGFWTLAIGIIMIFGTLIFLIIISKGLSTYINAYSFQRIAIFIIPWILEIIIAIFLVSNCLWLLIPIFWKAKNDNNKHQLTNLDKEQLQVHVDELNTKSKSNPFSTMKIIEQDKSKKAKNKIKIEIEEPFVLKTKNIKTKNPFTALDKEQLQVHVDELNTKSKSNPFSTMKVKVKKAEKPIDPTKPTIWTKKQIEEVWEKGEIISQFNPQLYRKDYAGALIFKKAFVNNIENSSDGNIKTLNWTIVYEKPPI